MPIAQLIIAMNEQGQLQLQGPEDFGTVFMLLEAARELTLRRFMPEKPPSQIVVPNLTMIPGNGRQ